MITKLSVVDVVVAVTVVLRVVWVPCTVKLPQTSTLPEPSISIAVVPPLSLIQLKVRLDIWILMLKVH